MGYLDSNGLKTFWSKIKSLKLANPNKLKFTGASTAEYDGSANVVVNIPTGGSGSGAAWGDITGTIDNQTDLINKFNEYVSLAEYNEKIRIIIGNDDFETVKSKIGSQETFPAIAIGCSNLDPEYAMEGHFPYLFTGASNSTSGNLTYTFTRLYLTNLANPQYSGLALDIYRIGAETNYGWEHVENPNFTNASWWNVSGTWFAVYNQTTFAEIKSAIDKGYQIFLYVPDENPLSEGIYRNKVYPLINVSIDANVALFGKIIYEEDMLQMGTGSGGLAQFIVSQYPGFFQLELYGLDGSTGTWDTAIRTLQ